MSLITAFEYRSGRTARIIAKHKCARFTDNTLNEGKILQLETYAKDGTTGQIFQLDQRMARELLAIITKVFPEQESMADPQA